MDISPPLTRKDLVAIIASIVMESNLTVKRGVILDGRECFTLAGHDVDSMAVAMVELDLKVDEGLDMGEFDPLGLSDLLALSEAGIDQEIDLTLASRPETLAK